jgi:hypothetical protein
MFRQMFRVTSGKTASGDGDFGRSAFGDGAVVQWAPAVLGAGALVLALGAVQLDDATGHGLASGTQVSAAAGMPDAALSVRADDSTAASVNRAAKADRAPVVRHPGGVTLSFKVPGIDGVSVATRLPGDAADALRKPPAPATLRGPAARPVIACEPVVSVLTTVAKQLGPGRCVT